MPTFPGPRRGAARRLAGGEAGAHDACGRLDVVSDGDFIEIGSRVRVVKIEGSRVVVTPVA